MERCDGCERPENQERLGWKAPRRDKDLAGILNVDKPPGITSHDVVDAVRRLTGQRKVGHAGTLDPMATGVLLLCLGKATRVSEYLMAGCKRYRATIVFGTETDTYDAQGQVVRTGGRTDYDLGEIQTALESFRGSIDQIPPMYSALKLNGEALYKLARQGKTVAREPRPVEVYSIDLLDWTIPALTIEISCSSGTYVRSLAHDLGKQLGGGGHLAALVRLQSGSFSLEEAVSLDLLEEAFQHGCGEKHVLPMDEGLLDWPALILDGERAARVVHGQMVTGQPVASPHDGMLCRAYDSQGAFVAILAFHTRSGLWRPKKVFVAS